MQHRRVDESKINIKELITDFSTIVTDDDDLLFHIKTILTELPTAEKNMLVVYAELGSYSAAARKFNCSSPTFKNRIVQVIEKIKAELQNRL